jgi:hypothetical protein
MILAANLQRLSEIVRAESDSSRSRTPLLAVTAELKRMKRRDEQQALERYAAEHRAAVWDEVLKTRREVAGPNWRPSWADGVGYQADIHRIIRRRGGEQRSGERRTGH